MKVPVLPSLAGHRHRHPGFGQLLAFALLLSVVAGAPAAADVLVLRDGSRIETQGKWETKGRQLVFKTASGTLSAVRAAEVDLEASEQATAEALAPKAAEAKPVEKKPVLVLTDKNVPKALPEGPAGDQPPGAAPAGGATAAANAGNKPGGAGQLEVVRSSLDSGSGDEIAYNVSGTVQNNSASAAGNIKLLVIVSVSRQNENRRLYCETSIETAVPPKGTADFTCPIRRQDVFATGMADAFDNATLSFEVRSTPQAPEKKNP